MQNQDEKTIPPTAVCTHNPQAKHLATCHGPDQSLQSYLFDFFNSSTSTPAPKPRPPLAGAPSFKGRALSATTIDPACGDPYEVAQHCYSLYHACATHSATNPVIRAFSGVLTGQLPEAVLLQQQLQLAGLHSVLHALPRLPAVLAAAAVAPEGSVDAVPTAITRAKSPADSCMVSTELALEAFEHMFPHRPAHKLSRLQDALRLDFPSGHIHVDNLLAAWAPFKEKTEMSLIPVMDVASAVSAVTAATGLKPEGSTLGQATLPGSVTAENSGKSASAMGLSGVQLRAVLLEQHLEEVEAAVTATAEQLQQLCISLSEAAVAAQVKDGDDVSSSSRAASPLAGDSQVLLSAFERQLGGVVGVVPARRVMCHVFGLHAGVSVVVEGDTGGDGGEDTEALRLAEGVGFCVTAKEMVAKLLATLVLPGSEGPAVARMDLGAAMAWAKGLGQGGVADEGASSLPSLPAPA